MIKYQKTKIELGYALDVGIKRQESPNQDEIGFCLPSFFNKQAPLFVVSDGMGGHQEGARAAKYVIKSILRAYKKSHRDEPPADVLNTGIEIAHKKIKSYVDKHKNINSMGAALAAAVIKDHQIHLANIGDVRVYLINEESIQQISFDHSFVAEQLRQGLIKPEEALRHPRRNVLTKSVTSKREEVEPFTNIIDYSIGDVMLLCSDGLWGTVTESQIQDVVLELTPQEAADKLVLMANMNQGPDNISVIIVKLV